MSQQPAMEPNGIHHHENHEIKLVGAIGKRKRDDEDEGEDMEGVVQDRKSADANEKPRDQRKLIQSCFEVLQSFDVEPPILKRPLQDPITSDEPEAKRQKSSEPAELATISDKVAASAYEHLDDLVADVSLAIKSALAEFEAAVSKMPDSSDQIKTAAQIKKFKTRALSLLSREQAYPRTSQPDSFNDEAQLDEFEKTQTVLSLVGFAPQERRLFSSLPSSHDLDLSEYNLPVGVSMTKIFPSDHQEDVQTLGDLFAPSRTLLPLQPPKQPKTQARGNALDFYHPSLTDKSQQRGATYFSTKLSAGHYLDYSHATPSSTSKTRQHERAQSLAGKKPSTSELELSEMESLFRGAFSSFAPCKDDSAAVVPSNIAGRIWWQRSGRRSFSNMIEVEYLDRANGIKTDQDDEPLEIDEEAIQDAIDNWDDTNIDPSLEDAMGSKQDEADKEADEILDEVSDLIETLASYQRIRNLTLPNSQNRQTSDPVTGDMLATAAPQPSEAEHETYQMLKAQLALIVKTLPPYAVAKLNGDRLDDLLISTKVRVSSDQYKGVMEEDEAGLQARLRAQQQAAQSAPRPAPQRTPSVSYQGHYQQQNLQYGTPTRTPAQAQAQQYYRQAATPNFQNYQQQNYQQARNSTPASLGQPRPPQPNQYTQRNGINAQYATQLAKAQTPYGHQNMPQFASQQRPAFSHVPPQSAPQPRFSHYQGYPQQASTPSQPHFGNYVNGAGMPQQQRTMSPQVSQRQPFSPSPNMQQAQRYGTPTQPMSGQPNRFPPNSNTAPQQQQQVGSLTGYHTVMPEAQQQRMLEQAKARVAAQERSTMFTDKIAQPGVTGLAGIGLGGSLDVNRMAAVRASMNNQSKPQTPTGQRHNINGTPGSVHVPPHKVTPVPVPPIPGLQQQQRKPSS
ncbi:unnamed protein product [Clonostachys chloroleuca]|uniref:Uncharacterized protein n=1 Tax=Clonostachys chloroleuca TaxID=1926264 RepID=A0AA35MB64_9HYPO|nr:unnamed protein product [Clonostachys chloroleuca]